MQGKQWEQGWSQVQISALAITSCATLDKLFNFSEPQVKNKLEFTISASQAASKDKTKEGTLIMIDGQIVTTPTTRANTERGPCHTPGTVWCAC